MKYIIAVVTLGLLLFVFIWSKSGAETETPEKQTSGAVAKSICFGETEEQKQVFADNPNLIFFIGRTLNPNIVIYESVTEGNAPVDVKSSWIMLNENGQREGFGMFDNAAYGHNVFGGETSTTKKLRLTALSKHNIDRLLALEFNAAAKRVVATTTINGARARLVNVWVEHGPTKNSWGLPKIPTVYYLDLHGYDASENYVTERIEVNP